MNLEDQEKERAISLNSSKDDYQNLSALMTFLSASRKDVSYTKITDKLDMNWMIS